MHNGVRWLASLAVCGWAFGGGASADEPRRITNEDFVRSDRFLLGTAAKDVLNGDLQFQWIGDGSSFYYRSQSAQGTRYLQVDSATGKKQPLFDHAIMASVLTAALNTQAHADKLPIERL